MKLGHKKHKQVLERIKKSETELRRCCHAEGCIELEACPEHICKIDHNIKTLKPELNSFTWCAWITANLLKNIYEIQIITKEDIVKLRMLVKVTSRHVDIYNARTIHVMLLEIDNYLFQFYEMEK